MQTVDLVILAGFLGSGKTTTLADYLRSKTTRDTAVIINEAGEVGIDGVTIANEADTLPMAMLVNGCVCCTLRSGLISTIHALLDAPRPEGSGPIRRIILETSGVSRPGPIIASLADPTLSARGIRVAVVTVYDCTADYALVDTFDEAAAQFAAAQRIVLSKVDCIGRDGLQEHIRRVRELNPLAQIVASLSRDETVAAAFNTLPHTEPMAQVLQSLRNRSTADFAHSRIHVLVAELSEHTTWADFAQWVDNLAAFCGERLLRFKAVVKVSDQCGHVGIQSVGTTFGAPYRVPPSEAIAPNFNAVIMIVRDLDTRALQEGVYAPSIRYREPSGLGNGSVLARKVCCS